ncbi:MAG TPA: TonB-dependent receptor, partial [Myxococcota bacterium]|nr:TonB-dependent receptor [Myxococcota bacterium]
MVRRFEVLGAAAIATALVWTAAPAIAQEPTPADAQPAPAAEQLGGIEEIVVTARRRMENQQDVPISVSALSGDELSFNTVQDVQDIEKAVPGIQIRAFGARTSTASITMRGQQAGSDVSTVDGAVGVYINEVYVAREKGLNQSLFDIDSVQVLRGPQGTLFGRNTTGGALLVSTKLPDEDFGGYLKALTGDYSRYGGEGALNVPLGETLATRLAFSVVRRNGYSERDIGSGQPFVLFGTNPARCELDGTNCTGRQDVDDESSNAWRFSLVWDPTDQFSSRLVHDGFISNTNGAASFLTNTQVADPAAYPSSSQAILAPFVDDTSDPLYNVFNSQREGANFGAPPLSLTGALITAMAAACSGAFSPGAPLTAITGVLFPPTRGLGDCLYEGGLAADEALTNSLRSERRSTSEQKQRGAIRSYGASWINEYDFDFMIGKLIFGYRDISVEEDFDLDGTANQVLFTNQFQDQNQYSIETLFNGVALADALDWTTGFYFFKEQGTDGSNSPSVTRLGSPINVFDADFEHSAYSFYLNGVYRLTDEWSFTAGYRYSTDKREMIAKHTRLNLFTGALQDCSMFASDVTSGPDTQRLPLADCRISVDKTFHAHTGQLTAQWQPTDNFQTYLNVRRGYRSGGFNLRA